VAQSLDLIAEIYYVTGAEKKKRLAELAELFEIKQHLHSRVRTLSLGERMRCEIVASLIHKPRVLLADEPTIGLDIVAKNKLRELIRQWQEFEGTTLMLTSHDLSDVEALCERCILIDQGAKQFDGKLRALKGDFSDLRRIHITVPSHELKAYDHELFTVAKGTEDFVHSYEIRTKKIPINHAIQALSNHYQDHMQDLQVTEVTLEEVLEKKFRRHNP
jgi:ABC-2 type transport system ATP-binding protein